MAVENRRRGRARLPRVSFSHHAFNLMKSKVQQQLQTLGNEKCKEQLKEAIESSMSMWRLQCACFVMDVAGVSAIKWAHGNANPWSRLGPGTQWRRGGNHSSETWCGGFAGSCHRQRQGIASRPPRLDDVRKSGDVEAIKNATAAAAISDKEAIAAQMPCRRMVAHDGVHRMERARQPLIASQWNRTVFGNPF